MNVSARELQQPNFGAMVVRTLADSGLPAGALEIEVPEAAAMAGDAAVTARLTELRQAGVRIAIDDVGTGSSSAPELHRFPVDTIKIDRHLIASAGSAELQVVPAAMIGMARTLGLTVVAEGVETEEQLIFVSEQGCDAWQGHLFGVAAPAEVWNGVLSATSGAATAGAFDSSRASSPSPSPSPSSSPSPSPSRVHMETK